MIFNNFNILCAEKKDCFWTFLSWVICVSVKLICCIKAYFVACKLIQWVGSSSVCQVPLQLVHISALRGHMHLAETSTSKYAFVKNNIMNWKQWVTAVRYCISCHAHYTSINVTTQHDGDWLLIFISCNFHKFIFMVV